MIVNNRTITGELTSPSIGVESFKAGIDAAADGDESTAVGSYAEVVSGFTDGSTYGYLSYVEGDRSSAFGHSAEAGDDDCSTFGASSTSPSGVINACLFGSSVTIGSGSSGAIGVGAGATISANTPDGIGIGRGITISANESVGIGVGISIISPSDVSGVAIGANLSGKGNMFLVAANEQAAYSGFSEIIAMGGYQTPGGASCIMLGNYIETTGAEATVVGASGIGGFRAAAFGRSAEANANYSMAGGYQAKVNSTSARSIVWGQDATINGAAGAAILIGAGGDIAASAQESVGIGDLVNIDAAFGTGVGRSSSVTGSEGSSFGLLARAGLRATALGSGAQADGDDSGAWGKSSSATHNGSFVIGKNAASTAVKRLTIGTIGGADDLALQIGLGFAAWGSTPPSSQPTVTGSRGGNAALASLLTTLAATGLIIDGTGA
jgi:hypothetical protein